MSSLSFDQMRPIEMAALVASCPSAQAVYEQGPAEDFGQSFHIANQLHMHGLFGAAAKFYRRSLEQHPRVAGQYPLPEHLLSTQLLCEMKGGYDLHPSHLDALSGLSRPCHCTILGAIELGRASPDPTRALEAMGNSFEAFPCGHEADWMFLKAATRHLGSPETACPMPEPFGRCWDRSFIERIPRRLFFYWDKSPPVEIEENFARHRAIPGLQVDVYSQQRAEAFLHDYFGSDVKNTFLELRHPAEQADFFRPHVVYAYGGYYLDADLRVAAVPEFLELMRSSHEAMFSVTDAFLVDNGFFGAEKGSALMAECINILVVNCHRHRDLRIDMKTGPAVFTRALARSYYRTLAFGDPVRNLKIIDRARLRSVVEEYPVSYKQDVRNWTVFQAHHGIT